MSIVCEFCEASFSSKVNLEAHKKTAKYCLKKRDPATLSETQKFSCSYCSKSFTQNGYLQTHLKSCKLKNQPKEISTIESLEKKIQDLYSVIENLEATCEKYKERSLMNEGKIELLLNNFHLHYKPIECKCTA